MTSPKAEKHLQAINDDAYLRRWFLTFKLSLQEAVVLDSIMSHDFVTREALFERLYGGDEERSETIIAAHVRRLRAKIASTATIQNMRGIGYAILKDGKAALEAVAKEAA